MPADSDRFKRALLCQGEGDRVPLVELGIAANVKEKFLGRPIRGWADEVAFWTSAGYDYVSVAHGLHALLEPSSTLRMADGLLRDANHPIVDAISRMGVAVHERYEAYDDPGHERVYANSAAGIITTMEEFEQFPWVMADDFGYDQLDRAAEHLPPGVKLFPVLGYVFAGIWQLMGFENFCIALKRQPELISRIFDRVGQLGYEVLERISRHPAVGAIGHADDIAYKTGLMIGPKYLRRYLFPWVERYATLCHARGLPYLFHSDGQLYAVIDDLIACGVDALHPIEPAAMDIIELKARYGDRLCLCGNVDMDYPLTRGTPGEVEEAVKCLVRTVAPGGGYAIGSSNGISGWIPFENYQALRGASLEFGMYPISVQEDASARTRERTDAG
jgi:uroporphyrinogen decarboxylase